MEELRTNDYLKGIVSNLPESPGIYQYLNTEGTIIYVGKAKNLKRRVSSYFNREHEPGKTRVLVSKIADIRYIVVNTEEDALLLENNLIKKYKPRYNVLLKDDKTYPSICVQNEYFPRVFRTRKIIRNGSSYYGPYSHIPSMYALLDLIKHLYPLRTCHLNLSPENIRAGKFNVCLEYHIKNCAGPCIGKQSQEEYLKNIAEIKEILKGNTQEIERMLFQQMQELAAEMKFEEAQKVKLCTITSSPCPTPQASRARCTAAVPALKATTFLFCPTKHSKSCSKAFTFGPSGTTQFVSKASCMKPISLPLMWARQRYILLSINICDYSNDSISSRNEE